MVVKGRERMRAGRFDRVKYVMMSVFGTALSGALAFSGAYAASPVQAGGAQPFTSALIRQAADDMAAANQPAANGPQTQTGEETATAIVSLDISKGPVVISENGYCIGSDPEETPFDGVYRISGNSQENGIRITGGEHTVIFDHMNIDQRTLQDCYPLSIEADCIVHLCLSGENVLFSGSGYGGINVADEAVLDIHGFGEGTLSLLAYPVREGDQLTGTSAIECSETAVIDYPIENDSGDTVQLYAGSNRLDYTEVDHYSGELYFKIQYSINHHCSRLSEAASCTHGQYCLECGRETAQKTAHHPGDPATCEQPRVCTVCGEVLEEPLGHRGVWKLEEVVRDGKICRQEVMTCTVCGRTLVRDAS